MFGADLDNLVLFNHRIVTITIIGIGTALLIQFNGLYNAWPDVLNICQTLFFIPLILQVLSRAYNRFGLNDEGINRELQERLLKFNKNNENNLIYRLVLLKKLDFYSSFHNVVFIVYFMVVNTPVTGVITSAAFTGNYQLMAPIYLPYIDASKLSGFIVNAIVQLLLTEITFFVLTALDFQIMFFSHQLSSMLDVLTMKFNEFGNELTDRPQTHFKYIVRKHIIRASKIPNSTKDNNKSKLIQLIKDYSEITEFTSLLFKEMKIPVFMTITAGGYALCLSALTMLSNSTVIGALGTFFTIAQISTYCSIVTYVIHQYEKFLDRINMFPWYLLSKTDQKIYLQFLQICQNFDNFELPMIGTVDMELFTTVINTGYSYFMFVWNFVEIKNNFFG